MKSRKHLRSPLHDYTKSGAYFITICSNDGLQLFGSIKDKLFLNDAGLMLERVWQQMPERFPNIFLDNYVVMPNHFHAILVLGIKLIDGEWIRFDEELNPSTNDIVGAFKSITTLTYSKGVRNNDWPPFRQRLWQRSYFDRVIRDNDELQRIRTYILDNPFRWHMDHENPHRQDVDEFDVWLKNL